ncbi:MAG: NADPH-dependent F420 reductase [Thaumarchaeota archaeon]|nr:NADPH-dependent F420 reductase [Nitrososphaerota archaeon]
MTRIAIVGGTGELGLGLAARLANANAEIVIGSRDTSRAKEAALRSSTLTGRHVEGDGNLEAAVWCQVAILAIPELPSDETLLSLKPALDGKLVISPIVPMVIRNGLFSPGLDSGSAAERVASLLQTRVAAAFHTVPAARLLEVKKPLDYDVLVTAETKEVYAEVAALVSSIAGLRPLFAGPLRNSRLLETMTPALLNVGKLNGIKHPSIKVV